MQMSNNVFIGEIFALPWKTFQICRRRILLLIYIKFLLPLPPNSPSRLQSFPSFSCLQIFTRFSSILFFYLTKIFFVENQRCLFFPTPNAKMMVSRKLLKLLILFLCIYIFIIYRAGINLKICRRRRAR